MKNAILLFLNHWVMIKWIIWYIAVKNGICIWFDTILIDCVIHLYDFSKKVFAKGAKSAQHYINWTSALLGSIRWGKENLHSKPYILFVTVAYIWVTHQLNRRCTSPSVGEMRPGSFAGKTFPNQTNHVLQTVIHDNYTRLL